MQTLDNSFIHTYIHSIITTVSSRYSENNKQQLPPRLVSLTDVCLLLCNKKNEQEIQHIPFLNLASKMLLILKG